jgi:hypothetical protein
LPSPAAGSHPSLCVWRWPGRSPPPLSHSNVVDSSGQHQGPHAVDGGGDAGARAVSSRRADPACAGPGNALPSFSMRPPSTPSALLNKLWQLARVARATASPWTVVVFWVLPHMLLCRQSSLWCVAASGCLLLLHYILHISVVRVLQCFVPPCTPQPVCESSVVCSQLHELVVVQHQASLTHA